MSFFYPSPPPTPTISPTSESWDADDEGSDSEGFLSPFDLVHLSTSLTSVPEPQAIFNFHVCRDSHPTRGATGKSEGWANTSYLLWSMCATLADAGIDVEWTHTFEQWRPQWDRIQDHVKSYGYTHFSSEIPPAPIGFALVRFDDSKSFEIEQDGCGGEDQLDVWALWRFVIELPVGENGMFEVVLMDTV
jgi:hypothetical protein